MGEFGNVPLCGDCWEELNPRMGDGETSRVPFQVLEAKKEQCDRCGKDTEQGIYVRKQTTAEVPLTQSELAVLGASLAGSPADSIEAEILRKVNDAYSLVGW